MIKLKSTVTQCISLRNLKRVCATERTQEVRLRTDTTEIRRKEQSFSRQRQRQNLPANRWNEEYWSPRGFVGALYTLSAFYSTLLVLICTPWVWCVCHVKCILLGSDIKQLLLTSSWVKGGVYFTGSLLGSISQWEQKSNRSKNKPEKKKQQTNPNNRWKALLSLMTPNVHKILSTMLQWDGWWWSQKIEKNMAAWPKGARLQRFFRVPVFHCFKSPLLSALTSNWYLSAGYFKFCK